MNNNAVDGRYYILSPNSYPTPSYPCNTAFFRFTSYPVGTRTNNAFRRLYILGYWPVQQWFLIYLDDSIQFFLYLSNKEAMRCSPIKACV